MKYGLFLLLFSFACLLLHADDKIKMKAGSYMNGEVIRVSEKGILFKMRGMEKVLDFSWSVIDDECKTELVNKYGMSKDDPEPPPSSEVETKESSQTTESSAAVPTSQINSDEERKINYLTLGSTLLSSYLSNMRSLIQDLISGIDYDIVEGITITTNDGKMYRGEIDTETETSYKIKLNELSVELPKKDIKSAYKSLIKIKKGKVDLADMLKYAETTLHENCLKLSAVEVGLSFEQAKYVWGLRLVGGELLTESGSKKILSHKINRSVELNRTSYFFTFSKGLLSLKAMPDAEKWNGLSFLEKENILTVVTIVSNFSETNAIEKTCPACNGKGVFNAAEPQAPPAKKSKPQTGRFGGGGGGTPPFRQAPSKPVTCTTCQGKKVVYVFKYY